MSNPIEKQKRLIKKTNTIREKSEKPSVKFAKDLTKSSPRGMNLDLGKIDKALTPLKKDSKFKNIKKDEDDEEIKQPDEKVKYNSDIFSCKRNLV